jgi:DNA gyrase/topoisomerase IV subunit B
LYIVSNGKSESYYFTDEEFNAVKGKIKGEVQRNKGLGSLEPEQARVSMFGEHQRMDVMEYTQEAMNLLYELMGEDVTPRREFIMSNVDFSEIRE